MSDRAYRWSHHPGPLPSRSEALSLFDKLNERARDVAPIDMDRPIVLYGAGNLGALARDHLESVGRPPVLIVDRDADLRRSEQGWSGYDLRVPAQAPSHLKQNAILAISISTGPYVPLADALEADGWCRCTPFYDLAQAFRDRHPLNNGWAAASLAAADISLAKRVLGAWVDDRSRADHLRFAAWRLAREEWTFESADVNVGNRFFIPEVAPFLKPRARVIDAGAHHGSYLERFMATQDDAARIWAVEPDRHNRQRLVSCLEEQPAATQAAVTLHDEILSDGAASVHFHDGLGYASQISPTGSIIRRTTTIDVLGWDPTVIKLHLEGHELAALKGAIETIHAHRPLVMATIYHNEDGLFRTADWLMTSLQDYRFLLRAHGWCGTGLVIYALPDPVGSS